MPIGLVGLEVLAAAVDRHATDPLIQRLAGQRRQRACAQAEYGRPPVRVARVQPR